MQELFEIRLGSMTMGEYENKFLGLLKYVGFIKDDKGEDTKFLIGLPSFYKYKFNMMNPKP
jgi:hypothetical protein